jgi:predicted Fe-Mo cluster-binding NifX family protein
VYLLFVDSETMQYTAILNKSANASGGAGIEAAKEVLEQGAQVIISGNPGPNAMQVLTAGGVKAVSYAMGTVREVVENYKSRPTS